MLFRRSKTYLYIDSLWPMPESRWRYAQVVAANQWQTLCKSASHCPLPSSPAGGGWEQVLYGGERVISKENLCGQQSGSVNRCCAVGYRDLRPSPQGSATSVPQPQDNVNELFPKSGDFGTLKHVNSWVSNLFVCHSE